MNRIPVSLRIALASAFLLVTVARPGAQAPSPGRAGGADLKFEVASIKLLRDPGASGPAAVAAPGSAARPVSRFSHAGSIRALLQRAYQIPYVQQLGGPDWIREDTYIITATIPEGVESTAANINAMIKALLVDRFQMVVRQEERELPIYVLLPARQDRKPGPKLQPANCPTREPGQPSTVPPNLAGVAWERGPRCGGISSGSNFISVGGFPIARLAEQLQFGLGRPVVDRTGLPGNYVLELTYEPQAMSAGGDSGGPSLFTAIQEQLGLKLESERGPVNVLVIDRIERPTEN